MKNQYVFQGVHKRQRCVIYQPRVQARGKRCNPYPKPQRGGIGRFRMNGIDIPPRWGFGTIVDSSTQG